MNYLQNLLRRDEDQIHGPIYNLWIILHNNDAHAVLRKYQSEKFFATQAYKMHLSNISQMEKYIQYFLETRTKKITMFCMLQYK